MTDAAPQVDPRGQRPLPVTLASLLALIVGALSVVGGVLLLVTAFTAAAADLPTSRFGLLLEAIIALALGIVSLVIYNGLKQGRPAARVIFTVALVIAIASHIGTIAIGANVSNAAWGTVIDVIAIVLLWAPASARAYFSP